MDLKEALEFGAIFSPQSATEDRITLYNAVLNTPPGDIVEVGSASGGTTIVLIGAAEKVNKKVFSVDPYPSQYAGKINTFFYEKASVKRLPFSQKDFSRIRKLFNS